MMEGDPRNPKISLLKKYDIPIDHISYEYIEKCSDKKELERIVRILRSGEEGFYPDLLRVTEDRLRLFAPDSRVLRQETPILTKDCLSSDEWNAVEKDLLSWEEEMMVIDKSLDFEKGRIEYVGNKNLPDVRKIAKPETKPKSTSSNLKKINNSKNNVRIKSGDYASWDKFDVDKELLKIDVEQERKEEENQKKKREIKRVTAEKKVEIDVDKDSYSSMEQQVLANQAKDRGNECFKSGDLTNALKYYNVSLKLYATVNAYNNRAMTYLKLKQFEEAVKDCNQVLSQEKNNIKALHRRATAYQNMANNSNNFDMLALEDLKEIVYLEPNNKVAQLDLHKLKTKLGIQETGKKFRMPICESDSNATKANKIKNVNDSSKSLACVKDVHKNVDDLPLTYYGPSTSSFKCEPYSLDHRALSGSFLSTEVICKCNSNTPKQNPLCQKCGEAMCTPKPAKTKSEPTIKVKRLDSKSREKEKNLENGDSFKIGMNTSKARKEVSNEALVTLSRGSKDNSCVVVPKNQVKSEAVEKEKLHSNDFVNQGKNVIEPEMKSNDAYVKLESSTDDTCSAKPVETVSGNIVKGATPQGGTEDIENKRTVGKKLMEEVKPAKSELVCENGVRDLKNSNESNRTEANGGKTKSKKKKSKNHRKKNLNIEDELDRMTPVRVVHADKYLHPTSVEPKVHSEAKKKPEPEISVTGNNQFKAFVPNRQCLSVRGDSGENHSNSSARKSAAHFGESDKSVQLKMETAALLEGNKENVLKNSNLDGKGETVIGKNDGSEKPEVENLSPYEFAMLWDMWQKSDDTYSKRAQIIRSIDPSKLGEVIGVKLNSEMLVTLLGCLEKHFVETEPMLVVNILKQLPKIPRFGLIKMFLGDSDKNVMKNLIASVERKGYALEEETVKGLAS